MGEPQVVHSGTATLAFAAGWVAETDLPEAGRRRRVGAPVTTARSRYLPSASTIAFGRMAATLRRARAGP